MCPCQHHSHHLFPGFLKWQLLMQCLPHTLILYSNIRQLSSMLIFCSDSSYYSCIVWTTPTSANALGSREYCSSLSSHCSPVWLHQANLLRYLSYSFLPFPSVITVFFGGAMVSNLLCLTAALSTDTMGTWRIWWVIYNWCRLIGQWLWHWLDHL